LRTWHSNECDRPIARHVDGCVTVRPCAPRGATDQEKIMIGSIKGMSLCVAALAFAVSVAPPRETNAQHALTLEQAWAECLRQIRERGYTGPDFGNHRGPATRACIASFGHNP